MLRENDLPMGHDGGPVRLRHVLGLVRANPRSTAFQDSRLLSLIGMSSTCRYGPLQYAL